MFSPVFCPLCKRRLTLDVTLSVRYFHCNECHCFHGESEETIEYLHWTFEDQEIEVEQCFEIGKPHKAFYQMQTDLCSKPLLELLVPFPMQLAYMDSFFLFHQKNVKSLSSSLLFL